ncbi:hypothetical protein [Legionella shakespearei]|uniref:Uncharacterized protein n=1 Tax=Legionella shakespearei DSM 23087 TaxID=1122169 RepID=A0A0W0Z315_9GAMM|nr:hypothetical protein [Legionella shakespearei]KTD63508.1 hypothetical protein Lsha_0686 [Legionella shakespearei DSM 23087]
MNKFLAPLCALLFSSYSFAFSFSNHQQVPTAPEPGQINKDFSGTWTGPCHGEEQVTFIIKQNDTQIEFIENEDSKYLFTINSLETHSSTSSDTHSTKVTDAMLFDNLLYLRSYEFKKSTITFLFSLNVAFTIEDDTLTMIDAFLGPKCVFKKA